MIKPLRMQARTQFMRRNDASRFLFLFVIFIAACSSQPTPTLPSPTPSPTPTNTPTETPTPNPVEKFLVSGDYVTAIEVNTTRRWFTVHLPTDYQPGVPLPLVINLHALTQSAFQQDMLSRMNAKADEENFIVVNPQAIGAPPAWLGPIPGSAGQADMDFFEELLVFLQKEIRIDPNRIYATGLSNGATMANRLGCDMSLTFAAIAPVAGGHVAFSRCQIDHPVSVIVFHGTDDPTIPYDGVENDIPPVQLWVGAWAERNGCDPTPMLSHPHSAVTMETWANCDDDVEVALYTLEGGGHTWPGAPLSANLGSFFPYINATDVIWDFFEAHPKSVKP
jgi:polyhydroxybutyrate depolymerase